MTLERSKRTLLATGALVCFAAAYVLTPSDVFSQLIARPADGAIAGEKSEPEMAAVAPIRDAFAPLVPDNDPPSSLRGALVIPALPRPGPPRPAEMRVTAIATGPNPTAIVESDGATRAVTVGDALAGSRIGAITNTGIVLADGRRLFLAAAGALP
jgi:hypothetical protein